MCKKVCMCQFQSEVTFSLTHTNINTYVYSCQVSKNLQKMTMYNAKIGTSFMKKKKQIFSNISMLFNPLKRLSGCCNSE